MENALIQLKIHPHKVSLADDYLKNKQPFQPWVCSGYKLNPNSCKNSQSDQKIISSSIPKYQCENQCSTFMICGSCAVEMQDVAMLPEQVDHPLHSHALIRTYTQDNSWVCDAKDYLGCVNKFNSSTDFKEQVRYNCKQCDFDLCQKCIFFYLENPQMTYLHTVNSNIHDHIMTRRFDDNGWCCDGQKKNKGGCLSGITGFGQTTGFNRWRCIKCDFDLCEKCLQATIIDACPFQTPPTRQTYTALLESINKNTLKIN